MMDDIRLDGHKMMYHPLEVARWYEARDNWDQIKKIYPLYVEISPFGGCNFRCSFCAKDFLKYRPTRIEPEILERTLAEMGASGVKSVLFAGEGEPTLYDGLGEILAASVRSGIDPALNSNGAHFSKETYESAVVNCKWIRFSVNAGNEEVHRDLHRCAPGTFGKVLDNMAFAVEARRRLGGRATLGAQAVLVEQNEASLPQLAKHAREIGLDYLTVKPYSQHPESFTQKHRETSYRNALELAKLLKAEETENFKVHFRADAFAQAQSGSLRYGKCFSVPLFWAYLRSNGDIIGCSNFMLDPRFNYGNLNEAGFRDLWEGDKRRAALEYMVKSHDISQCRVNCRMDKVNHYLWELRNPSAHANFI